MGEGTLEDRVQRWFMNHITLAAALISFSAYAFTTFATKAYVAELDAAKEARFNRIVAFIKEGQTEDKLEFRRLNDRLDVLMQGRH